ncbi:hypothetical protein SARC_12489, partial [Sphaeroforma arctica JP610]
MRFCCFHIGTFHCIAAALLLYAILSLQHRSSTMDFTLVLHVDINRTLLMSDKAGRKTTEDIISETVASCVYGRVDANGIWVAVSHEPFSTPPDEESLVDFKHYIDSIRFPYPPLSESVNKEEQREKNYAVKERRKAALKTFTSPGFPGEQYRDTYSRLLDTLRVQGRPGEYRTIVNSFFHLLVRLESTNVRYRLIFRTFGTDLDEVAVAMNEFCDGLNPDFPEVNLPHLKLHLPRDAGAFFRDGTNQYLVLGTLQKPVTMATGASFCK